MPQPIEALMRSLHERDSWRFSLLLALPLTAVAFGVGMWLDPLSGQINPFDRVMYPILALASLMLEVVLWRYKQSTNMVLRAVVLLASGFFLGKLIYLLFFAGPEVPVQAEMTESFFWIPAIYVLSLFIPDGKVARNTTLIFFGAMTLCSGVYAAMFGWTPRTGGVIYTLIEMSLAHLALVATTLAFIGHKDRLYSAQLQAQVLHRMVHTDLLTGLPSRLQLDEALSEAVTRGETFTVLFIDIDGFKLVNDTLGHSAGDDVLREFANRLRLTLHPQDVAARISGDEFVVVVEGAPSAWATTLACHLLTSLTLPLTVSGQQLQLSASIGMSTYPEDGQDSATLLRHADAAMYQIKHSGKNGVRRFDAALDAELERNAVLTRELQSALSKEQLSVVYQPIYHLESGELSKVEALLRWTHPQFGAVSPGVFIPIAEASGQIVPIGRWVIQQACNQGRRWREDYGWTGTVTVNVSPMQFAQPGFLSEVRQTLLLSKLPAHCLELELTENALMQNPASVQRVLGSLRQLGVEITVDDFGTGYSSLAYLRDLPIGCVKIDRSFIDDLTSLRRAPQYAVALITAIVSIARTLNLRVVAEGIETHAQLEAVRNFGCDFGQGYFFSRPLDPDRVSELLDRGQPGALPHLSKRLN
ncbi:putative bifunctional diguanylate cyclase/phosphodiesterase [Deinococcus arenicola]|uniref:EAL domain-containing protein n=1 Tax=Deinococcus arenicola TaxID=2994950 RepID=A0ABU4DNX4_9DEIO|nr:EAL domain-containing protein [Deinococcus sp. ZS9-10]MDV6374139.1 EAL domain-containing protein [Deinococcus sp. ZS9-10]